MDFIARQVRIARRRMFLQRWLSASCASVAIGTIVAAGVIALDKFVSLGLLWWVWPTIGAALAVVGSAAWAAWRTRQPFEAAWQIDQRFGLRERVSSCLALSPAERESPVGRALVDDTNERARRLPIAERFPVRPSRRLVWPAVGWGVAALVALGWHPTTTTTRAAKAAAKSTEQAVQQSTATLRKKLVEQQQAVEKLGVKDADEAFQKLEQGARKLADSPAADRQQTLATLHDLARDLEQRRQSLTGAESLKEQFQGVKNFSQGPANRMADALRRGDAGQALKELEKLREQLRQGNLDEQARADLAKQLADMEQKIRAAAEAQQQALDKLQERIAQERAAGNAAEANALEEQLAKLKQRQAQQQPLVEMARQMKQAADALQQGDAQAADQQLDQMSQALDALDREAKADELLADAADQLKISKDQMNCPECHGNGCGHCQGGNRPGGKGGQLSNGGGGQGDGLGAGRGRGFRPENKNDTGAFDTRVRQKVGRGAAKITDFVDGPNARGQVQQEITTQWQAVEGAAADPLADQPLPRDYREHTKRYFDALREGR